MHGAEELNGEEEVMPTEEGQSRTELNADRMVATGEAYSSEAAAARAEAETSMENTCNKVESGNNLQPATFCWTRNIQEGLLPLI
eukprot:scaffold166732_cov36-Cyclotella_meneghiniana.AAC.2